jgi:hypothetical protein
LTVTAAGIAQRVRYPDFVHPLFELTERLPIPAGTSPFHVRGFYYTRLFQRAGKLPGGLAALRAQITDPTVRTFMDQKFGWNGWYDVFPTMPLYVAIARLASKDFESTVREATRQAAHDLVPTMFRFGVRWAGPGAFSARAANMVMHAVDFTRVRTEMDGETRSVGAGYGIPLLVAPNIANLAVGFFKGMLELAGAKDVSAEYTDVIPDGESHGHKTVTIRFDFHWRLPAATTSDR